MTEQALAARIRAALRLLGNEEITPAGRRVLEKILDEVTPWEDLFNELMEKVNASYYEAEDAEATPPCHNCGDTERIKARATRRPLKSGELETRYFCHAADRSCYKERRGTYFAD